MKLRLRSRKPQTDDDAYDPSLESPRTGRGWQGIVAFMWAFAVTFGITLITMRGWLYLWSPTILLLSGWSCWRSGSRMVEGAARHHEWVEGHRAQMARLSKDLEALERFRP
jgi:hypothetical protein